MAVQADIKFNAGAARLRIKALQGVTDLMASFQAEAGIPPDDTAAGAVSLDGRPRGASPAQYMHYQDRGYFVASAEGFTEVHAKPWFTGTIKDRQKHWAATLEGLTPAAIMGHVAPEAVMLKISHEMRNDLLQGVTKFGLVDTGAGRASIAQNVRRVPANLGK